MKTVVLVLVLSMAGTAVAQVPLPKTVPLKNSKGEVVGTATINPNDNIVVFRDAKGELTGSARIAGSIITYYDPNGKVTHSAAATDDGLVVRDATGKIVGSTK